jgi:hypothetical protein
MGFFVPASPFSIPSTRIDAPGGSDSTLKQPAVHGRGRMSLGFVLPEPA